MVAGGGCFAVRAGVCCLCKLCKQMKALQVSGGSPGFAVPVDFFAVQHFVTYWVLCTSAALHSHTVANMPRITDQQLAK